MIDWGSINEKRETIDLTVRDTATNDCIASVHGLPVDSKVSFLLECICREAGLPCRPQLAWDGKVLQYWETMEEAAVTDGAEIACTCQQALVTASHDGFAKIWNMDTGECETTLVGHNDKVLTAYFSPNGRLVVTASEDKTAKIWNTMTGRCDRTMTHADAVYSATFSNDGKLVVTASEDRTAKVFVVKTGYALATLRGHASAVYSAVFTADDSQVVTESRDGTTRLWNPKTGVCDRTMEEQASVYWGSYSPHGQHVATTPGDCTALVLNVHTGEVELTLLGHEDLVICAVYCPPRPKLEAPKQQKEESGKINWHDDKNDSGAVEDDSGPVY